MSTLLPMDHPGETEQIDNVQSVHYDESQGDALLRRAVKSLPARPEVQVDVAYQRSKSASHHDVVPEVLVKSLPSKQLGKHQVFL